MLMLDRTQTIEKLNNCCGADIDSLSIAENSVIFEGFHNDRYLRQCYYNLEEKYDDGIIPDEEWKKVTDYLKIR